MLLGEFALAILRSLRGSSLIGMMPHAASTPLHEIVSGLLFSIAEPALTLQCDES
jgi:hypothetical protein